MPMISLTLHGHEDRYAVEQLLLALFDIPVQGHARSALSRGKTYLTATACVTVDGKTTRASRRLKCAEETVRLRRRILQQSLYLAALPHLDTPPPWGALAGVRPTKITTRHLLDGGSRASADRLLNKTYFVSEERRQLALDCSDATVRAKQLLEKDDISLYVGIPFCPTRCAYCSFVSRSVGKRTQLLEPYLQALYRELAHTAGLLAQSGKHIRSLYIGGGTPTTLSARQLETLLSTIGQTFDLRRCLEFTVEGGRPDTLSEEKLKTVFSGGAHRISINPQTMQDAVLRACGRPHTAQAVLTSYRQAQAAGFRDINMDLIAGLPEDNVAGFCDSLNTVLALQPANITVHTLALKKDADLFGRQALLPTGAEVARMVEYANETLRQQGYRPYYLYRQKYMSGSFENVGWSRDNRDCLYNIYMMEELHTIISVGGGGMSKANLADGTLQRFPNPKFPEQYIACLDSVLKQKDDLFRLLCAK